MVASSSPSNLYVMWQEKVGSQWATKWASIFSTPGRVSDHNYNFNQNPAGHDYNGFIYDGGNLLLRGRCGSGIFSTSVEEKDYRIYTVDGM